MARRNSPGSRALANRRKRAMGTGVTANPGRMEVGKTKPKSKPKGASTKSKTPTAKMSVAKKPATKPKQSFGSAFSTARKAGKKTFMWNGKSYNTRTKEDDQKSQNSAAKAAKAKAKAKAAPKPKAALKPKAAPKSKAKPTVARGYKKMTDAQILKRASDENAAFKKSRPAQKTPKPKIAMSSEEKARSRAKKAYGRG